MNPPRTIAELYIRDEEEFDAEEERQVIFATWGENFRRFDRVFHKVAAKPGEMQFSQQLISQQGLAQQQGTPIGFIGSAGLAAVSGIFGGRIHQ